MEDGSIPKDTRDKHYEDFKDDITPEKELFKIKKQEMETDMAYCSSTCRFNSKFPPVHRSTQQKCINCSNCVSYYEDKLCVRCSKPTDKEYFRHHSGCKRDIKSKI